MHVSRITYRRGLVDDLSKIDRLPVLTLSGTDLTKDLCRKINAETFYESAGVYGNPVAGEPVQFDGLQIEYENRTVDIIVYNRAAMLTGTQDERFKAIHRLCCELDPAVPQIR